VPVAINDFEVTAQPQDSVKERAAAAAAASASSSAPIDPADFLHNYGPLLRDFIRDEIERHLRNLAD
jgi:hypothetical protein